MPDKNHKFQEIITGGVSKDATVLPDRETDPRLDKNNTYRSKAVESLEKLFRQIVASSISEEVVHPDNTLQSTLGHETVNPEKIYVFPKECTNTGLSMGSQEIIKKWHDQVYAAANALLDEIKRMVTHTHYPYALYANDTYLTLQGGLQNLIEVILKNTGAPIYAQQAYIDTILGYLGYEWSKSYIKQPLPVKIFLSSINPEWEWSQEMVDTREVLRYIRGAKK